MKTILFFLFVCSISVYGQNITRITEYQKIVKEFYHILYSNTPDTIEFKRIYGHYNCYTDYCHFLHLCKSRIDIDDSINLLNHDKIKIDASECNCFFQITQGLTLNEIEKVIDMSVLYEDDDPFLISLDMYFPNKRCIHFELSTESPSQILYISLNNGDNLEDLLQNKNPGKLQRIGIINDSDGFTYVREQQNKNSKIISQFKKYELFWYTPIGDSDWWPVYLENSPIKRVGFVHKSRIAIFKNFPKYLKTKLLKGNHC